MFEVNRPICLSTDYRRTGVGYLLFQKYCSLPTGISLNCGKDYWKLVLAESHFINEVESHYAPVEEEALALVYELESFHMSVLRSPDLLISVDHKTLVKIFKTKLLKI